MTLAEKVKTTIEDLNPVFEERADGYAEFVSIDEEKRAATVKLIGGRLY